MARRAVAKVDDLGELVLMGGSKIGETDTRLRPTQSRRQCNEQHCRKIVLCIEVTGVPNFTEDQNKRIHRGPPESEKPSSESTFYFSAIEFYLPAIPLPKTGRESGNSAQVPPATAIMFAAWMHQARQADTWWPAPFSLFWPGSRC
jgi:hypothetical protein